MHLLIWKRADQGSKRLFLAIYEELWKVLLFAKAWVDSFSVIVAEKRFIVLVIVFAVIVIWICIAEVSELWVTRLLDSAQNSQFQTVGPRVYEHSWTEIILIIKKLLWVYWRFRRQQIRNTVVSKHIVKNLQNWNLFVHLWTVEVDDRVLTF